MTRCSTHYFLEAETSDLRTKHANQFVRKQKFNRLNAMADTPFGKFRFDRVYEVHKTKVAHRGINVELSIRVDDGFTLDDAIPVALKFWKKRSNLFKAARETASSELLETLNERIEDEPDLAPISKTAFLKSLGAPNEIRLEFDADQKWFELSYYSDLYGDHVVNVTLNLTYDSIDADITNLY